MTAITLVALGRGQPLGWLPGRDETPVEVSSETLGPGDDLRLVLRDGQVAEVQCKKGLTRSKHLWEAMLALADGVRSGSIDWGVLAVCPQSSLSIRGHLARDVRRLTDGRTDGLSNIGQELLRRLAARGWPSLMGRSNQRVRSMASPRLRARSTSALPSDPSVP